MPDGELVHVRLPRMTAPAAFEALHLEGVTMRMKRRRTRSIRPWSASRPSRSCLSPARECRGAALAGRCRRPFGVERVGDFAGAWIHRRNRVQRRALPVVRLDTRKIAVDELPDVTSPACIARCRSSIDFSMISNPVTCVAAAFLDWPATEATDTTADATAV